MKSFERGFRRSAFEACFEGVELQGKGRQRQPKIRQLFYAWISIHGLQGSRQNGEFGQLCTSVRQYRDRTTRDDPMSTLRVNSGTASAERETFAPAEIHARNAYPSPNPEMSMATQPRAFTVSIPASARGMKGTHSDEVGARPRLVRRGRAVLRIYRTRAEKLFTTDCIFISGQTLAEGGR